MAVIIGSGWPLRCGFYRIGKALVMPCRSTNSGRTRYITAKRIGARNVLYRVMVEWDEDAKVWVASSDDVPGLATGADAFEDLIEKLKVVIPELLFENGLLPRPFDIHT
jgi:predicted RNase H-like HicB family nuclease